MPHSVIEKPSVLAPAAFDVEALRNDFPILKREVHGKPLVYLDNAATSQTPQQVIDVFSDYYSRYNANIHQGCTPCQMRRQLRLKPHGIALRRFSMRKMHARLSLRGARLKQST